MKFKYHKQYRLPEFDYSSNNGYFITIVTKDRQHFFGEIINQEMFITEIGLFVEDNFKKIEKEILHLKIHEYVIMPNHIHFIAVINNPEEKEYKNLRRQIQEKLIKFATRIPVFMYLTDYRERTLKDIITKLEPSLFKKVTGLTQKDFELLVSLGVFNSALMNDAVYKFKRYEDSSLVYIGVNKHEGEDVGLYDTVLNSKDYRKTFENTTKE